MTARQFTALCVEYTILPGVAIQNEGVRSALAWALKSDNVTGTAIVRNALEGNF